VSDTSVTTTAVYRCTQCPLGCRLEVDALDDEVVEVRGHGCRRGIVYGTQEHLDPRRDVSTTVALEGGPIARLPVRAAEPVRRGDVITFVRAVQRQRVTAPVAFGQTIARDVAGTGIDAIATRALPAVASRPEGSSEPGP
jgi:CxxC motif-containing protein